MASSPPPSSRLRPTGDSPLEHARGELRDALGGLKNLDQLLRSLRVGPRALASVIPDVHASGSEMRGSIALLLDALEEKMAPDTRAVDALREFTLPRLDELENALTKAMKQTMSAKYRLELERVVSRLAHDLDGARELFDLLEEATAAPSIRVDLLELLQQTFKDSGDATRLRTVLELPSESVELYVSPRVAMALFTMTAEFAAADGCPLRISLDVTSAGQCSVHIVRDPSASATRSEPRHVTEPVMICLESTAQLLGAELVRTSDGSELSLVWPADSTRAKRASNA